MEKLINKNIKVLVAIISIFLILGITAGSYAVEKNYTKDLKVGDVLSFTENYATAWNVYKTKSDASKTAANKSVNAVKYLKTNDKIRINLVSAKYPNVLGIDLIRDGKETKKYGYIHYGSDASKFFKKVEDNTEPQVKEIKFVNSTEVVTYGEVKEINFAEKLEGADEREIVYTSSNKKIATIDNTGKATINTNKKIGVTTITAKVKGTTLVAKCKLTVGIKNVEVEKVTIKGETKKVANGQTLQLTASVLPEKAIQDVIWESKNEKIATVDEKGLVTVSANAKSGDRVVIIAKSKENPEKYGTWTLTVNAETIKLNVTDLMLGAGEKYQLKATVKPAGTKVTWESSNTKFATVDSNGKVTINNKAILSKNGIQVGDKVTITAKAGSAVATCEIERITIATGKIKVGDVFDYSVNDEFKKIVKNESTSIIKVEKDGKSVTAKKAGKAKLIWQKKNGTYCKTVWYVQTTPYNAAFFKGKIYDVNKSVYCDAYKKHTNSELDSGEHYWHLREGDRFQVIGMDGNWVRIKIVSLTEKSKEFFKEGDKYYIFVSENPNEEYFTLYAWEEI